MALTDNLVSYWKLNETSGSRADSTGANNLTDHNSVLNESNSAKFVAASSQYLSCASNSSLQMSGNTDFTIAFWVKYNSNLAGTGTHSLVTKDSNAANSRDFTIDMAEAWFRFYIQGGGTYVVQSTQAPVVGSWYFIVCWYDHSNGQLHMRLNDTTTYNSVATGATGTDVSNAEFRIGARQYSGFEDYSNASIAGVGIWKRLLSPAEITQLAGGAPLGTPVHRASPIIPLSSGSWYDSQIMDFNVMVDPTDASKLMMFATGMAAPVNTGVESIGLFRANLSDPYTWTEVGQKITASGSGWESGGQGIRVGSVIYDAGTFYLYYNYDISTGGSIGVATSTDNGATWTKYASNPILTPTSGGQTDGNWISQPAVIKEGASWTMIYVYRSGNAPQGYRYATSSDGLSWTKGGTTDVYNVGITRLPEYHQILKIDGHYYLVLEEYTDESQTRYTICVADSSTVHGTYTNTRQIFRESGVVGAFDRYLVATPFMFDTGSGWVLYYCGASDHVTPPYDNHWAGGAAPATLAQITQYPPSATYPFLLTNGFFDFIRN